MDDVVRLQGNFALGTIFKFKGDMARRTYGVIYPEPGATFGIVVGHEGCCSLVRKFKPAMKGCDMNKEDTQEVEQVAVGNYNGKPVTVTRKKLDDAPIQHEATVSYDRTNDRVVIEFSAYARDHVTVFMTKHDVKDMLDSLSQLGRLLEGLEGFEWEGAEF